MFAPFGPIKHINMTYDTATGVRVFSCYFCRSRCFMLQHHKGFAFVEYEVPEGAELASQQMNGVLAGGKNMRVGKPSNMPQAQPIIEQILNEGKSYHRVYVASIHPDLSETDLRSVFSAFGNVTDCTLAKLNSAGTKHR
jgi:poly(U)-binding-splicing factor PUF60